MIHSTLTSKNQTTVPKAVVEALKLKPSDQLVYEIGTNGRVILSAKTETFASVAASLPKKPKPYSVPTLEDMDEAIKKWLKNVSPDRFHDLARYKRSGELLCPGRRSAAKKSP